MKFIAKNVLWAVGLFAALACAGPVAAEDLAAALAAGRVSATFSGNGGSSGDSIELVVAKNARAGHGTLRLTVEPGTRLQSRDATAQSMVIAGVRGRATGGDSYEPGSVIEVGDGGSVTYYLEGYCMEFEKENPSSGTAFSITSPDSVLACILHEADGLSTDAKQAAVWIHTDHATFEHVNEKFSVSQADWAAAEAVVKKCQLPPGKEAAPAQESGDSRKSTAK